MPTRSSSRWGPPARSSRKPSAISTGKVRNSVWSRSVCSVPSPWKPFPPRSRPASRRSPCWTAARSPDVSASRCISTSRPRWPTVPVSPSSAAASVWPARSSLPPWFSPFTSTSTANASTPSPSVSTTMSPICRCPSTRPSSPNRPEPPAAASGDWAPTVPSAPTRTPSPSSETTRTSTFRRISPTTPRSPAASPSAICASATSPSPASTSSLLPTSSPATTWRTSACTT